MQKPPCPQPPASRGKRLARAALLGALAACGGPSAAPAPETLAGAGKNRPAAK